jgi:hypothetical protein
MLWAPEMSKLQRRAERGRKSWRIDVAGDIDRLIIPRGVKKRKEDIIPRVDASPTGDPGGKGVIILVLRFLTTYIFEEVPVNQNSALHLAKQLRLRG